MQGLAVSALMTYRIEWTLTLRFLLDNCQDSAYCSCLVWLMLMTSLSGRLTSEYLADAPSDACQVLDAHLGNRF